MQQDLFGTAGLAAGRPEGLVYEPEFLSPGEEASLIELVKALPLEQARYKAYTARRRVLSFGGSFDYDSNLLLPAQPLVDSLHPLRERVAAWLGVPPEVLVHALIAHYAPGTPLGWHRDVPDFEAIAGVSLGSAARLRFRPYPPSRPAPRAIAVEVEARSIYSMQGPARWDWQHSVPPTPGERWSITFRTRRH